MPKVRASIRSISFSTSAMYSGCWAWRLVQTSIRLACPPAGSFMVEEGFHLQRDVCVLVDFFRRFVFVARATR